MKGRCPRCEDIVQVSGHRGSKLSDNRCPRCGVALRSVNAGVKRFRYTCPLTGKPVFIPGPGGVVLDQPHQVLYLPACESPRRMVGDVDIHASHQPEPDGVRLYQGGQACQRCCRFVAFEGAFYQVTQIGYRPCVPSVLRSGQTILGPGAVVSNLALRTIDSRPGEWLPFQLVPLTEAQAGDPASWVVNPPDQPKGRNAVKMHPRHQIVEQARRQFAADLYALQDRLGLTYPQTLLLVSATVSDAVRVMSGGQPNPDPPGVDIDWLIAMLDFTRQLQRNHPVTTLELVALLTEHQLKLAAFMVDIERAPFMADVEPVPQEPATPVTYRRRGA